MAAKGYSTINTVLKFGTAQGSLTKLCKIKSYPALGGEPEQIEITDLEDTMQTFVLGVQSVDSMTFTCNFNPADYQAVKTNEGKAGYFSLEFGESASEGSFAWEGAYSVYVNEGEVNGAREMTISVFPSTVITYTAP